MSVAALIVAAGRGARAAGEQNRPKQYCAIGGVPMLSRNIGIFAAHPGVDDILVVIHPDDAGLYAAASQPYVGRLRKAVRGGARRQGSARAGLEALASDPPSSVLIHDAARPFVSAELISRAHLGTLDARQGAVPGLPVTDTLKWVARGQVIGTAERDQLWRAQTPQGFRIRDDPRRASRRGARAGARVHRRRGCRRMVRPRCGFGRRRRGQSQAHHA